jgi:hypothetical protein
MGLLWQSLCELGSPSVVFSSAPAVETVRASSSDALRRTVFALSYVRYGTASQ